MDLENVSDIERQEVGEISKIIMPNGDILVEFEKIDTYVFQQMEDYLYVEGFEIEFDNGYREEYVYMGKGLTEFGEVCFYFDSKSTILKNKNKQKQNVGLQYNFS